MGQQREKLHGDGPESLKRASGRLNLLLNGEGEGGEKATFTNCFVPWAGVTQGYRSALVLALEDEGGLRFIPHWGGALALTPELRAGSSPSLVAPATSWVNMDPSGDGH